MLRPGVRELSISCWDWRRRGGGLWGSGLGLLKVDFMILGLGCLVYGWVCLIYILGPGLVGLV